MHINIRMGEQEGRPNFWLEIVAIRSLARPRRRGEDNIKMHLPETRCENLNWIDCLKTRFIGGILFICCSFNDAVSRSYHVVLNDRMINKQLERMW
jgi:hypothetical protein